MTIIKGLKLLPVTGLVVCHLKISQQLSSGAHKFTPGFSGVCFVQSLIFFLVFCRSLFLLFLLDIVLPVLCSFKWVPPYSSCPSSIKLHKIIAEILLNMTVMTPMHLNKIVSIFWWSRILVQLKPHATTTCIQLF